MVAFNDVRLKSFKSTLDQSHRVLEFVNSFLALAVVVGEVKELSVLNLIEVLDNDSMVLCKGLALAGERVFEQLLALLLIKLRAGLRTPVPYDSSQIEVTHKGGLLEADEHRFI